MPSEFHPMFNDASDADVVISSDEGTLFRLPSIILKRASGYFRSPPQPKVQPQAGEPSQSLQASETTVLTDKEYHATPSIYTLPFPSAPVERVMLMFSSFPTPPLASYAELEAAIEVMVYLDAQGLLSFARALCLTPPCLNEPVLMYGLGTRFGWDEIIQRGAELTLPLNLFPPPVKAKTGSTPAVASTSPDLPESKFEAQLSELPAPVLFKLLKFHRLRRDTFHAILFSSPQFQYCDLEGPAKCQFCSRNEVDQSPLSALGLRLVWEMDQDASGKSILELELGDLREGKRCFEAKCSNNQCQRKPYDMVAISKTVKKCIESLPTSISNGDWQRSLNTFYTPPRAHKPRV